MISAGKFGSEHRQTALRLGLSCFVLQSVPVFSEQAVGHTNDIGGDPIPGAGQSRKTGHGRQMTIFLRLLWGHWHHVAVEIGDDPDRAGDDEKDDQYTEGEGQNIVCAVGAAAQMQEKDEVNADLR